jgi:hypothetical protein
MPLSGQRSAKERRASGAPPTARDEYGSSARLFFAGRVRMRINDWNADACRVYLTPKSPLHTRRGDLIAGYLPLSVAWRGGRGVRLISGISTLISQRAPMRPYRAEQAPPLQDRTSTRKTALTVKLGLIQVVQVAGRRGREVADVALLRRVVILRVQPYPG